MDIGYSCGYTIDMRVPVIIEYIENPGLCKREKELYSKCVVSFGEPIQTTVDQNIFEQTQRIQQVMESMRKELWAEFGIEKGGLQSINKEEYLNHLYLKKFKAFGFKYDSEHETRFLLNKENEYCIDSDSDGKFVPGILHE